ncbi:MAG: 2,4-dichlorophenol 6-monooxygenase, partial [Pseudomonadota bacterium]
RDAELYHEHSSRPGAPVPHARLAQNGRSVSTLDLCGKGGFSLLTGIVGEDTWREAAAAAEKAAGVPIAVHVIGPGQEYDDPYGDWIRLRETQESGALLVRPDLIVGFRADAASTTATDDLIAALRQILALS